MHVWFCVNKLCVCVSELRVCKLYVSKLYVSQLCVAKLCVSEFYESVLCVCVE